MSSVALRRQSATLALVVNIITFKGISILTNIYLSNAVRFETYGLIIINLNFLQNTLAWIHSEYGRVLLLNSPSTADVAAVMTLLNLCFITVLCLLLYIYNKTLVYMHFEMMVSCILHGLAGYVDLQREPNDVKLCREIGVDQKLLLERKAQLVEIGALITSLLFNRLVLKMDLDHYLILAVGVKRFVGSIYLYLLCNQRVHATENVQLMWNPLTHLTQNAELLSLCKREALTSVYKYAVTEGDKILCMRVFDDRENGCLAYAASLSNVLPRTIYRPTETVVRNTYGGQHKVDTECTSRTDEYFKPFREASRIQVNAALLAAAYGWMCSESFLSLMRRRRPAHMELMALRFELLLLLPTGVAGLTDGVLHVASKESSIHYAHIQKYSSALWLCQCFTIMLTRRLSIASPFAMYLHWRLALQLFRACLSVSYLFTICGPKISHPLTQPSQLIVRMIEFSRVLVDWTCQYAVLFCIASLIVYGSTQSILTEMVLPTEWSTRWWVEIVPLKELVRILLAMMLGGGSVAMALSRRYFWN